MTRVNTKKRCKNTSIVNCARKSFILPNTRICTSKKNATQTVNDMQLHHSRILFITNRNYNSSCSKPNLNLSKIKTMTIRWRIVGSVSITHVLRMHYANSHSFPQCFLFPFFVLDWRRSTGVSRKFQSLSDVILLKHVSYV